jgi:hypothetical protein
MRNRLLIYLLLIVLGISCSSEKEDPIPVKTGEELAIESLAGTSETTYSIANGGSIRRNNLDESRIFDGFTLRFNVSGRHLAAQMETICLKLREHGSLLAIVLI